jgi:hypothetical protein
MLSQNGGADAIQLSGGDTGVNRFGHLIQSRSHNLADNLQFL